MSSKDKRKKRKISQGTKENLNSIINELSIIIGRKAIPEHEPVKSVNEIYTNVDTHIAAIGIVLPEIDENWRLYDSRKAFIRLKKKRQFRYRLLITLSVIVSLAVIAGAIVGILYIESWYRWIVLAVASLFLLLGSTYTSKIIIDPVISRFDKSLAEKFPTDCEILNSYVQELVKLRRKL
jgi:hypothetical protein